MIAELYIPYEEELSSSELRRLMAQVRAARSKTWQIVSPKISALVRLDTQLDQAAKNKDQQKLDELSTHIGAIRRDVQPVTDSLKEIDGRLAAIEKLWAQVDSTTGFTVLARMLRAEALRSFGGLLLHAAVVASGGTTRTIRNLWRTLWSGDGVSFSGGAVARWALLGPSGIFIKGGVETATVTYKDDAPASIRSSDRVTNDVVSLWGEPLRVASLHSLSSNEEKPLRHSQPKSTADNSETRVRDTIPE